MATAVLRSHDALSNRMHIDAFTPSPAKPRRRRSPKPASPPPRAAGVVASPAPKPAAGVPSAAAKPASPPPAKGAAAPGRRSPPARPAARKQPSPTKEKPKQRLVMEEVRILKRGEEPPAPAPARAPAPVSAARAPAAAVEQRALCSTSRIGPEAPPVVPTRRIVAAPAAASDAAGYAGPAFSAAAPEPSALPMPAFCLRRAESEATRGLRCLLGIGVGGLA